MNTSAKEKVIWDLSETRRKKEVKKAKTLLAWTEPILKEEKTSLSIILNVTKVKTTNADN